MPETSGTYNFQSVNVEILIRQAFRKIGISGEFLELEKLDTAKTAINLLLLEWLNKSSNLWTLQSEFLPLITNQSKYTLPTTVSNIIQVNLRTSTRILNGTPQTNTGSSYDNGGGGTAADAFDGNPDTACTQTVTNGNISYDYGVGITQQINFVGITSFVEANYTIVIESSPDTVVWTTLLQLEQQTFEAGVNHWFDIPAPISTKAYRIRETGGATLDIAAIYFNNNIFDLPISNISRYEYYLLPNKNYSSRPTTYYLDRGFAEPTLFIWPTPTNQYNCLQYSYKEVMQDVGLYTETLEIPARFYPALVAGLSYQLAINYNPEKAQILKIDYEISLKEAQDEDTEDIPINIIGDYTASGESYL